MQQNRFLSCRWIPQWIHFVVILVASRVVDAGVLGHKSVGFLTAVEDPTNEELSPQACHLRSSWEYCPANQQCVPDKDCSSCEGFYAVNDQLHQCEPQTPLFIKKFCGEAKDERCYWYAATLKDCINSCNAQYFTPGATGAYGACITGAPGGGCPSDSCSSVCCTFGEGGTCRSPCIENCNKYQNCVVNGKGATVTNAMEFDAYLLQCIFGGPPPPGKAEADCGCSNK